MFDVRKWAPERLLYAYGFHYLREAYLKVPFSSGWDMSESKLKLQHFNLDGPIMDDIAHLILQTIVYLLETITQIRVYEAVFGLEKYFMNGEDLYLKLSQNAASFVFMSGEDTPAHKACMVRIDDGVYMNHARLFEDNTAKYLLTRTKI